jgi:hypothetical protein
MLIMNSLFHLAVQTGRVIIGAGFATGFTTDFETSLRAGLVTGLVTGLGAGFAGLAIPGFLILIG